MKKKIVNSMPILFVLLFTAVLTADVWADSVIKAKVDTAFNGARADVAVHSDHSGNTTIDISASGFKPNSVYTVWFVNIVPKMTMTGVGYAPYAFTTDVHGNATYTAEVKTSQISNWQVLKVVMHKDGNPENMNKPNRLGAFMVKTGAIITAAGGSMTAAPESSSY